MESLLSRIKDASGQITRTVDLGDFEESYRGATFEVNVTPSRAHLRDWGKITEFIQELTTRSDKLSDDEKTAALAEYEEKKIVWLARTWTNINLEEAREIRDHLEEANPLAWDWLLTFTSLTIGNFRKESLKN